MSGIQEIMALRRDIAARSDALREIRVASGSSEALGINPVRAGEGGPQGIDFAQTLSGALQKVNAAQAKSGEMQVGYERGEVTDIAQVMLARQEAGVAFEATLQVRNKLLSAYQEIMRMGA